jgi:hypothetical protein
VKATALLCDWAEAINGKLYIQGGGWTRLTLLRAHTFAVAVQLFIPWDLTNRKTKFTAAILTEDGKPIYAKDPLGRDTDDEIKAEGELEVGRPPGLKPGSDIAVPMVLRYENVDVSEGRYLWVLTIDEEEVSRVSFDVSRKGSK